MGACLSCAGNAAPDQNEVYELVFDTILKSYHEFFKTYKKGMDDQAPESYKCEEILEKDTTDGYRTLTKGVDDDERVKNSALTAATAEGAREHIKNEVWEHFEEGVVSKTKMVSIKYFRSKANEAARNATDNMVDKSIDKARDFLAEMLARGQDLPQPKEKKPEEPLKEKSEEVKPAAEAEDPTEEPTERVEEVAAH